MRYVPRHPRLGARVALEELRRHHFNVAEFIERASPHSELKAVFEAAVALQEAMSDADASLTKREAEQAAREKVVPIAVGHMKRSKPKK